MTAGSISIEEALHLYSKGYILVINDGEVKNIKREGEHGKIHVSLF